MARQPTPRQFHVDSLVRSERDTNDMLRQQRLFRLFQALRGGRMEMAEVLFEEEGVGLDEVLLGEEAATSVPGARTFIEGVPPADPSSPLPTVTLLAWAAAQGRLDVMEWLLDNGASITMPLPGGRDAAWVAMEAGQDEAYEFLMDRGAPAQWRLDSRPRLTRLMGATLARKPATVAHLLTLDRSMLDHYDDDGRTALFHNLTQLPYTQEDLEITRLLLAAGADGYFTDNDGINPLDHATRGPQLELLNELGVDLSMQNPIPAPELELMEPDEPAPDEPAPPRPAPRPSSPGRRPR